MVFLHVSTLDPEAVSTSHMPWDYALGFPSLDIYLHICKGVRLGTMAGKLVPSSERITQPVFLGVPRLF